jgi:hypothetical protein
MGKGDRTAPVTAIVLSAAACLLALVSPARGREVRVPLRLDAKFLRQALMAQVFTEAGGTARVWDDGTGCNYLVLSAPAVDIEAGRVRVTSPGEARIGTALGGSCLLLLDWTGTVEVFEEPRLDESAPVIRFAVVDSELRGENHRKGVTGTLWDWVKRYVHPRIAVLTIDLRPALREVRSLLPLVLPSDDVERTRRLVDSVSISEVHTSGDRLVATLQLSPPEPPTAGPGGARAGPAPEPTFSPEELRQWEAHWQHWDAFLTFVLEQAAGDSDTPELREALLEVLLDARYDILGALAPTRPGQPDPVPALFVRTWKRLAPVLRRVSARLPSEQALRYLSFIAAADALRAIEELGPQSGLDISADGLRRLARMIAPGAAEDPVAYSLDVDPRLRRLFGFGEPLPPPADNPDVDLGAWLIARAWAGDELPAGLVSRLNHWVPSAGDVDRYLPLVRDLLHFTADRAVAKFGLEDRFHELFHATVLATAWQESCWRQFVEIGGRLSAIRSAAGSVGIMQVNLHVWRGFYDAAGLQKDISYNANAGSEILLRYLRDQAIAKGEHKASGGVDNLARATYAVYNAGPAQLRRYRRAKVPARVRRVDDAFYRKYRTIRRGDELAVAECYGR